LLKNTDRPAWELAISWTAKTVRPDRIVAAPLKTRPNANE
jgi:hypothetical protein